MMLFSKILCQRPQCSTIFKGFRIIPIFLKFQLTFKLWPLVNNSYLQVIVWNEMKLWGTVPYTLIQLSVNNKLGYWKLHPKVPGSITGVGRFFLFNRKYLNAPFNSLVLFIMHVSVLMCMLIAKDLFSLQFFALFPFYYIFFGKICIGKFSTPDFCISFLFKMSLSVWIYVSFKGKSRPGKNIKGLKFERLIICLFDVQTPRTLHIPALAKGLRLNTSPSCSLSFDFYTDLHSSSVLLDSSVQ